MLMSKKSEHTASDMQVRGAAREHRPSISRKRVMRVALSIIDARGIDALSLRTVAARLGIRAPSLYNYFHSKAELLQEIARSLLVNVKRPQSGTDWRENILQIAVGARRAILRHPKAAPLLLLHFPREVLVSAYERSMGIYDTAPELHLVITEGVEKLTLGSALFTAASRAQGKTHWPSYDKNRYPKLAAAVLTNLHGEDSLFEETLRRFLQGFPTAAKRRRAPPSKTKRLRHRARR